MHVPLTKERVDWWAGYEYRDPYHEAFQITRTGIEIHDFSKFGILLSEIVAQLEIRDEFAGEEVAFYLSHFWEHVSEIRLAQVKLTALK